MKRYIVIYTSKRGSTKQYAEWIAEDLACEALPLSEAAGLDLHGYDCVIIDNVEDAGGPQTQFVFKNS